MTTRTIRNGATITVPVETGETLKIVAVTGTYTATIVRGTGIGTALATAATGGSYGPYAYAVVVSIVSSASSEIDFDVAVAPVVDSDTVPSLSFDSSGNVTGLGVPGGNYPIILPQTLFNKLKKWRAALAGMQSGAADAKLAFVGDSTDAGFWASGSAYTSNRKLCVSECVAKRLTGDGISVNTATQFGTGNVVTASLGAYDPQWTFGVGWTRSSIQQVLGGALLQNTADASVLSFTPTNPDGSALSFDKIEVTYLKNSTYANFTIGIDGGAALYTSTQAGSGALDTALVSVALGAHTVNITKTAGDIAKTFFLASVSCYDSTKRTVRVFNMAGGGMNSGDMSANATYYGSRNGLALAAPHLTIINCTINDALEATPLATYTANIQAIITTAKISGDVILRTGNTGQAGYNGFVANSDDKYISALYALSVSNSVPFLDIKARIGSYTEAHALGFIVDGLHPTRSGYQDIANAVYEVLKPQ